MNRPAKAERQTDNPSGDRRSCSKWVVGSLQLLLVILVLLSAAVLYYSGTLVGTLFRFALLLAAVGLLVRIWGLYRRNLALGFWKRPFAPQSRPYTSQFLNRSAFWLVLGGTMQFTLPVASFAPDELEGLIYVMWGLIVLMVLLELFPPKRIYRTPNALFAVGWIFLLLDLVQIARPPDRSEAVIIDAAFRGEWEVFHGGRSPLLNHHYGIPSQQFALDLDRALHGPPPEKIADKLESYTAFGELLYAPSDGTVVEVVNDLPDNPIGKTDAVNLIGNHVTIEIRKDRYVLMAHLLRGSVGVKTGDRVRRGQQIAKCGNSGNTSEPHLHLQIQDRVKFDFDNTRTFPILFRKVTRVRYGRAERLDEADVRRNDRIIANK